MVDAEFCKEYAKRIINPKTLTEQRIKSVCDGKEFKLWIFDDSTLEHELKLDTVLRFVYKFCRDNQEQFK